MFIYPWNVIQVYLLFPTNPISWNLIRKQSRLIPFVLCFSKSIFLPFKYFMDFFSCLSFLFMCKIEYSEGVNYKIKFNYLWISRKSYVKSNCMLNRNWTGVFFPDGSMKVISILIRFEQSMFFFMISYASLLLLGSPKDSSRPCGSPGYSVF